MPVFFTKVTTSLSTVVTSDGIQDVVCICYPVAINPDGSALLGSLQVSVPAAKSLLIDLRKAVEIAQKLASNDEFADYLIGHELRDYVDDEGNLRPAEHLQQQAVELSKQIIEDRQQTIAEFKQLLADGAAGHNEAGQSLVGMTVVPDIEGVEAFMLQAEEGDEDYDDDDDDEDYDDDDDEDYEDDEYYEEDEDAETIIDVCDMLYSGDIDRNAAKLIEQAIQFYTDNLRDE